MHLKEGAESGILPIARQMVAETVKEDGCKRYELVRDIHDVNHLIILETWESRAHLDAHSQSAHYKTLIPKMDEFRIGPTDVTVTETL
jgi:quinol monooxygenase YgiN